MTFCVCKKLLLKRHKPLFFLSFALSDQHLRATCGPELPRGLAHDASFHASPFGIWELGKFPGTIRETSIES